MNVPGGNLILLPALHIVYLLKQGYGKLKVHKFVAKLIMKSAIVIDTISQTRGMIRNLDVFHRTVSTDIYLSMVLFTASSPKARVSLSNMISRSLLLPQ